MILADFITLGIFVLVGFAGAVAGFGRTLKAVTSGFFGVVVSLVVTYFLFGLVLKIGFVQNLVSSLVLALENSKAPICALLLTIRIDMILVGVVLFILVQLLRKLVVYILKKVFEAKNPVSGVFNKVLGVILSVAVLFIIVLVAFQIVYWITKEGAFYNFLKGSFFRLDKLYVNNPLANFISKLGV